jgi:hypothetical protein
MNVLLAIMLNVLTYYARKQTDWNGSKARAVAQQTEACLVSLGLRDLFEKKRQEFLFVQTRFQSLSARSRKEFKDDSAEFASRLLAFQLKGAQSIDILRIDNCGSYLTDCVSTYQVRQCLQSGGQLFRKLQLRWGYLIAKREKTSYRSC